MCVCLFGRVCVCVCEFVYACLFARVSVCVPSCVRSFGRAGLLGEYASTQTLVIHQWAGPSVIAQLAPDSTPDRAE